MKFFGREPAEWLGLLEVVLVCAAAFVIPLSDETVDWVVMGAGGAVAVITALAVRPIQNGIILGGVKAILAASVGLGLELTADQTAVLYSTIAFVLAWILRDQVNPHPKIDPLSVQPEGAGVGITPRQHY